MLVATAIGVILIPAFFVLIERKKKKNKTTTTDSDKASNPT
jgi:hypothetical protein